MTDDVGAIAAGLSEAQVLDLTDNWDHFCEADYCLMQSEDESYPDDLESAGFVYLDAVDADDLETPFADELGIVEGGSVYRFTPLGLAVRDLARQICAQARPDYAAGFLSGKYDDSSTEMRAVLIALALPRSDREG